MREYQKIETVFKRSEEGNKKLIEGEYRNPVVEYLKDLEWIWTEKIDGTNIRICWDGHNITFAGRTDKAQLPGRLRLRLKELFLNEPMEEMFEQLFGEQEVIIFGEGYGDKIQAIGRDYLPDSNDFIVFDMLIGNHYLKLEDAKDIANKLGLDFIPIIDTGTIEKAVEYVKSKPKSKLGTCISEGLVCRPKERLYDRDHRIIVKIKVRDFETE